MEIIVNKEVIKTFEDFYTDPYFVEYLSVNAPNYTTATLVLHACEELTKKLSKMLNEEK